MRRLEDSQSEARLRGHVVQMIEVPAQTMHHVFRSIGDALRFRLTNVPRQTNWKVYIPWIESTVPDTTKAVVDSALANMKWTRQDTAFPLEFEWHLGSFGDQEVHRLTFHGTTDVFLIEPPKEARDGATEDCAKSVECGETLASYQPSRETLNDRSHS